MKTSPLIIAVIGLAVSSIGLRAHEGHDHGPGAAKGSALEAWKSAQASLKAIESAASTKQHEIIHNEQEKLAASLKHVQEHSQDAPDKTRLEGAIKNAITASERVHAAADAKDFAKVDSSLKTLQTTMALVEKQLPTGAK